MAGDAWCIVLPTYFITVTSNFTLKPPLVVMNDPHLIHVLLLGNPIILTLDESGD